jgi:hypothetical protein
VTFSVDEKLRTVLWGWSGDSIPDRLLADLERLHDVLASSFDPVDRWLAEDEREMLRTRVRTLLEERTYPLPPSRWPAVPWPVF